jgi:hypothetical protein
MVTRDFFPAGDRADLIVLQSLHSNQGLFAVPAEEATDIVVTTAQFQE